MAIYHLSVKIVGRGTGRSSVGAAAYRAGEKLFNNYDGIIHDYRRKNWIEYKEIILPKNAPKEYADRETLWNAVEQIEKSKDSRLARELLLALPVEFSKEQQIEVVRRFVNDKLNSLGMIADVAIHCPPVRDDKGRPIDRYGNPTKDKSKMQFINPHAHILVTMRPIAKNGQWEKKTEVEYVCKKGNEEKAFTATEFKQAKEEGWEKQYKFKEGRKKVWLTMSEGKERELERVNRTPKTTPYGRENEKVAYWNDKDRIFEWRQHWENVVNEEFKQMQSEIRIDCRSFKDQGRTDEIPTIHMGMAAINMEKKAERELREGKREWQVVRSDIGNINRQIKEHNRFIRELKNQMDNILKKAKETTERMARKLEGIRAKIIGNSYEKMILSDTYKNLTEQVALKSDGLEKYIAEREKIRKANTDSAEKIKELQEEIKTCNIFQIGKKNALQNLVKKEKESIKIRTEYMKKIRQKYGFSTEKNYQTERKNVYTQKKNLIKLEDAIKKMKDNTENLIVEYEAETGKIHKFNILELQKKRGVFREEMERAVSSKLEKKYTTGFDKKSYEKIVKHTDKLLGISENGRKKAATIKQRKSIKK